MPELSPAPRIRDNGMFRRELVCLTTVRMTESVKCSPLFNVSEYPLLSPNFLLANLSRVILPTMNVLILLLTYVASLVVPSTAANFPKSPSLNSIISANSTNPTNQTSTALAPQTTDESCGGDAGFVCLTSGINPCCRYPTPSVDIQSLITSVLTSSQFK